MYKKCKLIYLKSEDKCKPGDLCISSRYKNKFLIFGTFENSYINECIKYDLCVLSDDYINTNNWLYSIDTNSVYKCTDVSFNNEKWNNELENKNKLFKVIAASNVTLELYKIPSSVINEFTNNTEVMVEYAGDMVKVNSNNEIIIKSIKLDK